MSDSTKPRRRISLRHKLLFLGVILCLTLGAAEWLARKFTEKPQDDQVHHPYLRRVRRAGLTREYRNPETGGRFTMHIDQHGFRCRSLEPPGTPKAPNSYRIFFVGASTTENEGIPDEQTFPALVEAELNERLGPEVQVRGINTAISANRASDSFSLIAHRLLTLEPDLIVMLHAINDLRWGMTDRFDPTHYRDRYRRRPPGFKDVLRRKSHLFAVAEVAYYRLGASPYGSVRKNPYHDASVSNPYTPDLDPSNALSDFRRYYRMTALLCRDASVPLVLMTQPTIYRETMTPEVEATLWMGYDESGSFNASPQVMREGMEVFNAEIRTLAAELGTGFIDLEAAIPKDLEHMWDDCHYTVKGNQLVADTIVEALLANGELPRPSER